jgi:hypothetical protein
MSVRLLLAAALFVGAWWLSGWLDRRWRARRLRRSVERMWARIREAKEARASFQAAADAVRREAAACRLVQLGGGSAIFEVEGELDDERLAAELRRRFGPRLARAEVFDDATGRWHPILISPSAQVGDAAFPPPDRRAIEEARKGDG